jgi:hypothetical protein
MPYDPATLPYIINVKELPANQAAAALVQPKIVSASQWCMSPYYTPNWGQMNVAPNQPGPGAPTTSPGQAISPVATASVTWPDAQIMERDLAANTALNAEKTRLTNSSTGNTNAINAINGITGGAPSVGTISPTTAVHGAATPVTIMGGGFSVSAPSVTIGGVACTSVVVVNDGELTCTTGTTNVAGPPAVDVKVTTTGGSATLAGGMTFT